MRWNKAIHRWGPRLGVWVLLLVIAACTSRVVTEGWNTHEWGTQSSTAQPAEEPARESSPLPDYLGMVWPSSNSTLTAAEYSESLEREFITLRGGVGIGAELRAERIAEAGDFDVNWIERSSFIIDGLPVERYGCDGEFADGAVLHLGYEDMRLIFRVAGPYYMAWRVPLGSGEHVVTFQVRRTSGTVLEYTWRFIITP